jgi:CSLREA domain-containing protein
LGRRIGAGIVAVSATLLVACQPTDTTTFVVDSTYDEVDAAIGDGVCATASGTCTLRAAVQEANALPARHRGVIRLAFAGSYSISRLGADDAALVGDLDITGDVRIVGALATVNAHGSARVFHVLPGARLEADHLFVAEGVSCVVCGALDGREGGGGILNEGALVLGQVLIRNSATGSGGGALHQVGGSSLLTDVWVTGSMGGVLGGAGAAVWIEGGTVVAHRGSLHGNGTTSPYVDGDAVIRLTGGTLSLVDTTITGHRGSPLRPTYAALQVDPGAVVTVIRSTLHDNDVTTRGTGTVRAGASVLERCAAPVVSLGFGVDRDGTCLAVPLPTDRTVPDPGLTPITTDQGLDRMLLPVPGSPLLDAVPAGTALLCDALLPLDQRGQPRPAGPACDIGSVERQPSD